MTARSEGLALLAGEVVVVALALVLVATSGDATPVGVADAELSPTVLGAGLLVAGTGLGGIRTADHVDARAALGELGLGVAAAVVVATDASPLVAAAAAGVAVASATLRVDPDRVTALFDR